MKTKKELIEMAKQEANSLMAQGNKNSFETLYKVSLKALERKNKAGQWEKMSSKEIAKHESRIESAQQFAGITYNGEKFNHLSDYQAAVNKDLRK